MKAEHRVTGVARDHKNAEKDHFYPTPPDATRALLKVEQFQELIWEPACGDGAISKILKKAGHKVISTDLVDRGYGESRVDFLMEYRARAQTIITNPPFKLATPFIRKAIDMMTMDSETFPDGKIAMLLRLQALEGVDRRKIFESSPLARVHVFSGRIQMKRPNYEGKGGGMMAFAWFVWENGYKGKPTIGWI